jgi:hypothetical protein
VRWWETQVFPAIPVGFRYRMVVNAVQTCVLLCISVSWIGSPLLVVSVDCDCFNQTIWGVVSQGFRQQGSITN